MSAELRARCQDCDGLFRFATGADALAALSKNDHTAGCPVCDGQLCNCAYCLTTPPTVAESVPLLVCDKHGCWRRECGCPE